MPIVFNFLYIFLKKLKLIEPNISVAIGTEEVVGEGGGGGFRGIGVRMKHS